MIKNSLKQTGSAHVIIIVILVVALIGALGFVFWQNFISKGDSKDQPNSSVTEQPPVTQPSTDDGEEDEESVYKLKSTGATFAYPSDWVSFDTYPNGVTLKSPDFKSEIGFYKISKGSTLTVSTSSTVEENTDDVLLNVARSKANGEPATKQFIDINGIRGLRFTHTTQENKGSGLSAIFIKDKVLYTVGQQYHLNSSNPYPELIDSVLKSFKLK